MTSEAADLLSDIAQELTKNGYEVRGEPVKLASGGAGIHTFAYSYNPHCST